METPRWELISHLYHAALERPPAERGAFLKDACTGDAALQQELESLLRYEPAAARFLDIPVSQIGANAHKPDLDIVGRQLGPYTIAAQIGVGGMGEVYRARDRKLGRDVAIKTLPPELASDPNRLTRFQREARALATLNHPNIAAIYGLEESAGGSYLVLELVDGETLADRLSQTGPMATGEVLRIASQIAEALEAAHGKGITHRDIKPSNVKVTPEGRVKVLDFGLAKSLPQGGVHDETSIVSTSTALHTQSGAIVGTPPYMSPEQIRGQVTDQRTDVWAFGCVVYELLSGRRPFRGSTLPDIFAAILQSEPDWHDLPAGVPEDVRTLLRRCLEKDASRRWQGFDVVRRELARARSAATGHERMRPQIVLLFGAVPVALAALLAFGGGVLFGRLQLAVYDTILRWSTTPPPDPRVVIVDIDDRSLATIGQWPWRRDVIGHLIARLRDLGAATIALDLLFPELDRYEGLVPAGDGSTPGRQGTPDELLADSIRAGKVVLGHAMTFQPGAPQAGHCELHPLNLSRSLRVRWPTPT